MLFESQIDIDGKHLGYYLLTYHTVGGRLTHRYNRLRVRRRRAR